MNEPAPTRAAGPGQWGLRALLVGGTLVFCGLVIELALRLEPGLFGPRTANQVFSRYGTRPGDIYFFEPTTRVNFMLPNFETRAYFNGYWWNHATDSRGFRNPPGRPVDGTLLLGDSLLYGHGVEEDETTAHYLESEHGWRVYNLSRQGDCLYQHYVLLRLYLDEFRPARAILFVFYNDFDDLFVYRSRSLLEEAPEISHYDYEAIASAVADLGTHTSPPIRSLLHRIATYRLSLALLERLKRAWEPAATLSAPISPDGLDPTTLEPVSYALLWSYYDRILGDLAVRAAAAGTQLQVVYLNAFPDHEDVVQRQRTLISEVTGKHAIPLLDTGDLITACPACMLPGDGHLTAEGHRRLARFLDESLGATGDP